VAHRNERDGPAAVLRAQADDQRGTCQSRAGRMQSANVRDGSNATASPSRTTPPPAHRGLVRQSPGRCRATPRRSAQQATGWRAPATAAPPATPISFARPCRPPRRPFAH
jgi:hypothetical protein